MKINYLDLKSESMRTNNQFRAKKHTFLCTYCNKKKSIELKISCLTFPYLQECSVDYQLFLVLLYVKFIIVDLLHIGSV
jgi:transposase-like protein